jgi:predicted flap endonuclease-1-like 5' DNA nuclease
MNDTATAGGASGASLIPSTTDAFTYAHLIVLAIFAVAVLVAIVWGMRLKRQRRAAEQDIAERNVEVEQTAEAAAAPVPPAAPAAREPEPEPVTAPPPAVAPEPAPLADEPITASAPLDASPATEAVSAPSAAEDDLSAAPVSTLKGLGPKLVARLGELGITTVGQIAALTDDEAMRLDAQLGPFAGRITRDRWIEQARFLAAGDTAGFEAVFGRL